MPLVLSNLPPGQFIKTVGTREGAVLPVRPRVFDVEQRQAEADQLRAQLDKAQYDLDQTMMRAPGHGYVSALTLNKGDVNPSKSVMSVHAC